MKYVSIDIETTGLNPDTCQILEVAAVIELGDKTPVEDLPWIQFYVQSDYIVGEIQAIVMNAQLLERMSTASCTKLHKVSQVLANFIKQHLGEGPWTVAGKNFGSFDYQFLKRLPKSNLLHFRHRFLDPAMLYIEPGDDGPPRMEKCLERAMLDIDVAHRALPDARQVVQLLRAKGV